MSGARLLPALAPVVLLAHVAEEAPGFLDWFNRHAEPDLTLPGFVALNVVGLLVTVLLAAASVPSRSRALALALIGWLSFLMLANGLLHLTASLWLGEYVPGTVTAGVLYLPYYFALTVTTCRDLDIRPSAALAAAAIGVVPMLVQGVSVLALGRRVLW